MSEIPVQALNKYRDVAALLQERLCDMSDAGTEAALNLLLRICKESDDAEFVEIVVTTEKIAAAKVEKLLRAHVNVLVGVNDELDHDSVDPVVLCWLDDHGYVEVGAVSPEDDIPMRQRMTAYAKRLLHGGIGTRALPLMKRADGSWSFIVELGEPFGAAQ
ncbi:hypothetical protein ACGLHS_31990 [Variovorax sp. VaC1]|uniref:hypothetical protein n=1 Tax=Variovorax sp. VaC1 TaxID=3373132 RepID=UPI00374A944E